ncbi:hypothetical protein B0H19DRAFT_1247754 [Mycena capillaripes]|nr:hypothetical protein B0H19DRAFT_1247754 [Mycena capillaripes]
MPTDVCRRIPWTAQRSEPEDFERGPPPRTWIFGTWYNDPTLPDPWSTDWDDWNLYLFEETFDGKLKVDKLFKDVFDVPGTVEPLAFVEAVGGDIFLFTAGGRYYFYSDGMLTVHRMDFASPKEFLDHVLRKDPEEDLPDMPIEMRPGTDLKWLYK